MSLVFALGGGGAVGVLLVPWLTRRGLRELQWSRPFPRWLLPLAVALGAVVAAAVTASLSQRVYVATLPAAVGWSCALAALALCDAMTQRLPTALIRQATVVVAALLIGAGGASGDWRSVVVAAIWAVAAAAALYLAVLVAGAGPGDMRLALLGGLGMGHATVISVLLGLAAWAVIIAGQAGTAIAQGGSLKDRIALGPGMVAGCLLAALATG